jgi:IS30 family transposase
MIWSDPTDPRNAARRAGGRRRYNATRQFLAAERRLKVARLVHEYGNDWGVRARIAQELGVHRSTVTRDIQAIREGLYARAWRRRAA